FLLMTDDQVPVGLDRVRDNFVEVFGCALQGVLENDGFNRLVLHAGLAAQEVRLLRTYAKYLRQTGVPFSLEYMQLTLKRNPRVAKALVELFAAKFRPPDGERRSRPPRMSIDDTRDEILRE